MVKAINDRTGHRLTRIPIVYISKCAFFLSIFNGCSDSYILLNGDPIDSESDGNNDITIDSIADDYYGDTNTDTYEVPLCVDNDGDSFTDYICGGLDCNDSNANVHPGATEICNDGIDQDCSLSYHPRIDNSLNISDYEINGYDISVNIAWSGSQVGIIWGGTIQTLNPDYNFVLKYSAADEFLGSTMIPVTISNSSSSYILPEIDWCGSYYCLTYTYIVGYPLCSYLNNCGAQARYIEMSPSGHVDFLSDYFISVNRTGAHSMASELAWTGSQVGIFWMDALDWVGPAYDSTFRLEFGTYNSTYEWMTEPVQISALDSAAWITSDTVWTGSEFGVMWIEDLDDIQSCYLARIGFNGDILDIVTLPDCSNRSMTWSNGKYNFASDNTILGSGITFNKYDPIARVFEDSIPISDTTYFAGQQTILSFDDSHFIIWLDGRNSHCVDYIHDEACTVDIYLRILQASGMPIGSEYRLTTSNNSKSSISVVYTGRILEVAWVEHNDYDTSINITAIDLCFE